MFWVVVVPAVQVARAQVLALYKQYRVDFIMFGYTPDFYLELARQ